MFNTNSGNTQFLNHSWSGLRLHIMIGLMMCMCFTQVIVNASSQSSSTCKSSNCSLREWLITLEEEALSVECTLSKLQKSTALLSKVNYRTTSMRLSQIEEVKKTLSDLKGEIEIISSTCSTFDGPDCNITTLTTLTKLECNSKCLTCGSSGQCSSCSGNWNGPTCSQCKSGWKGTDCNTPICDSKCIICASPGQCSNCTGNWNGPTCSQCKTGWNGIDCNSPICGSNCASCASSSVCSTCKTGWYGSDCNSNIPLILSNAQITKFQSTIMSNAQITSRKLLFKASRDGFAGITFHSKCDNKGPTIVIVKATSGAIFGGYTSVSWGSFSGYAADPSAFLFSLVASTKEERFLKLTYQNGYTYKTQSVYNNPYAIYSHVNLGPVFGGGNDIYIDYYNTNTGGLCHTYCDTTMTYGASTTMSYLAGSSSFQIEDYEVYSL